jgi:threonine dehydrogenase-like Zn-dependent dehydrogenase
MEKLITTFHHDNRVDTSNIQFPTIPAKRDPTTMMKALCWKGNASVSVDSVPKVQITDPGDALIKVTATTVCGSDLHLYHNEMQGMAKGDIMGHEAMGIVEQVGPQCKNLKVGDRVVISFLIACGKCAYCERGEWSCCDTTNPSKDMEKLYGHRTAGLFGYSRLTGGYEGCQAEYIRVPYADNNTLKIPAHLKDEQVLLLSDVLCTSYHACECAYQGKDDVVAVWGAGPIGLATSMWAFFRGAKRVILIDHDANRLALARKHMPNIEIIDYGKEDVVNTMHKICPGGPDVSIDAVGFRFPTSIIHKLERTVRFETDSPQILNEAITCTRKGGRIGIIGDYYAYTNHFHIGAFMEKSLQMRGGQAWVQRYWAQILQWIDEGKVDGTWLITHHMPFTEAAKAYGMFDQHQDGAVKIMLQPHLQK